MKPRKFFYHFSHSPLSLFLVALIYLLIDKPKNPTCGMHIKWWLKPLWRLKNLSSQTHTVWLASDYYVCWEFWDFPPSLTSLLTTCPLVMPWNLLLPRSDPSRPLHPFRLIPFDLTYDLTFRQRNSFRFTLFSFHLSWKFQIECEHVCHNMHSRRNPPKIQ